MAKMIENKSILSVLLFSSISFFAIIFFVDNIRNAKNQGYSEISNTPSKEPLWNGLIIKQGNSGKFREVIVTLDSGRKIITKACGKILFSSHSGLCINKYKGSIRIDYAGNIYLSDSGNCLGKSWLGSCNGANIY